MINVALVDDHVIVRSGFAQLLSLETDMNVVGEFSSVVEARVGLPACKPNVVILDISMADESGLTLLSDIPSGIACVMLSVHDSPAMVESGTSGSSYDSNTPLRLFRSPSSPPSTNTPLSTAPAACSCTSEALAS